MKILFVMPTLRVGGAEKALVSLLNTFDTTNNSVDLMLFEKDGPLQKNIPESINIIGGDVLTRGMTLEVRYYLKDLIKSGHVAAAATRLDVSLRNRLQKTDFSWDKIKKYVPCIKEHYDVAVGYLEGVADFFIIDKVNADKKIGWIHTNMKEHTPSEQEHEYYGKFDNIVTISDKCLDSFVTVFPELKDKISVIENIVDPKEIREKANELINVFDNENKKHLVTVGRIEYQKGIDIAAKTAKKLKDDGVNFIWHVYGQGTMEDEIIDYVAANGIGDCFILEGLAMNPYPYMKAADIIVQPSRNEGKSIVLDEAKILGKPIVVTNYASVSDQITDGITGLISGMTPDSIAKKVEELIFDENLKDFLSANCLANENTSIKSLEKLYRLLES